MTAAAAHPRTADSLWEFAVAVYGRPGVKDACLALQDRFGVDVNLVIFCLWVSPDGVEAILDDALDISRAWQSGIVAPLRSSRRALKTQASSDAAVTRLRDQVKAAELEAERLQLSAMAGLAPAPSGAMQDRRKTAAYNLAAYFRAADLQLDPLGQTEVLRILDGAFGA